MRGIFEKSKKSLILKILDKQSKVFSETSIELNKNNNIKEIKKEQSKVKEIILTTDSVKNTYATTSMFILECLKYFRENNIQINTQDFMTLFSFMKEYEDEFVHMKYDEKLKKGEINKK